MGAILLAGGTALLLRTAVSPPLGSEAATPPSGALPNGVYTLTNVAYTDRRMDVKNDGTAHLPGGIVQQYSANASATFLPQLFKITYVLTSGGIHYYDIRPMKNSCLGVKYAPGTATPITTGALGPTDGSTVEAAFRWGIESVSGSVYTLKTYSETAYLASADNGNLEQKLTTLSSKTDNRARWTFAAYTGGVLDGSVITEKTDIMYVGDAATVKGYSWSTTIGDNAPRLRVYETGNPAFAATNKATINESTGQLTANGAGIFTIYMGTQTGGWWVSSAWEVEVRWDTGCYYIGAYSNPTGQLMRPSTGSSSLNLIEVDELGDTDTASLWRFKYVTDGYYTIKNEKTGRYFDDWSNKVYEYATSTIESYISAGSYSSSYLDEYLWKFYMQSDGSYKIQSRNRSGTDYYVTMENSGFSTSDPDVLIANTGGDRQKWRIRPLTLNIRVKYDQKFVNNYPTDYMARPEAVFGNNSVGNSIKSTMFEQFGIRVKVTYTLWNSLPDRHNCTLNSSDSCAGSWDCYFPPMTCYPGHHTNCDKLLQDIPGYATSLNDNDGVNVLFTGYTSCQDTWSGHHIGVFLGYASTNRTACFVEQKWDSDPRCADHIMTTTLHEMGHLFDAPDDYNTHFPKAEDYRNNCVWGRNSDADPYLADLTICSHCKAIIDSNKYKLINN